MVSFKRSSSYFAQSSFFSSSVSWRFCQRNMWSRRWKYRSRNGRSRRGNYRSKRWKYKSCRSWDEAFHVIRYVKNVCKSVLLFVPKWTRFFIHQIVSYVLLKQSINQLTKLSCKIFLSRRIQFWLCQCSLQIFFGVGVSVVSSTQCIIYVLLRVM